MVTTRSSAAAAAGKPIQRPQRPQRPDVRDLFSSAQKRRALKHLQTLPGTPPKSIEEWLEKKVRRANAAKEAREAAARAPVVVIEDEKEDEDEEEQGVFFTMAFDAEEPAALSGSDEAIALLRKVETAKTEKAAEEPSGEPVSLEAASPRPSKRKAPTPSATPTPKPKPVATPAIETPTRPIATPSGFFGRSFSALKRTLGFSPITPAAAPATAPFVTPQPPTPEPFTPELSQRPTPGSLAEILTIPPTPVGERVRTPSSKRKKTHSTLRALMKGVEPQDKRKAEAWARKVYADLRLDPAFKSKRARLETPVRVQDLVHMPCAKPWEGGYGDPLYYLDDEDIVPGWAVYLDMVAEEEDHQPKKVKTAHNTDEGEVQSLNEMVIPRNSSLYDSHGSSASLMDFHPRRSVEPSPMFETPVSHKQGGNVFSELKGHANARQARADERESFQNGYKPKTPKHNPAKGSFSFPTSDDDSSDDEPAAGDGKAPATPQVWTKAPPPAPVPAHAPLPEPVAETPRASSVGAPETVDEVQRQRKMLMKHTPAKPSRLREATYPSPSLLSDAGNESILAATPVQVATSSDPLFDDMPIMDSGDMDMEDLGSAEAYIGSTEWKNQFNASSWPAPPVYESDEEVLSPI
ncbi:hypothetical protein IQ07DRAFT_604023 [Pyrenochaeta sp. DS3sAY3a]|nr:hypothetical protein IQ07DRAFT_604023 [Pyrenochaeta sp. DS3sAY3a]